MNVPSGQNHTCPIKQEQIHQLAKALVEDETGRISNDRQLTNLQEHINCGCPQCQLSLADRMEELSPASATG